MSFIRVRSAIGQGMTMLLAFLALSLVGCGSGGDLGPAPGVPPVITTQPASITADDGTTATFTVTATGEGLTYQWRRDGSNVAGATLAVFSTPSLGLTDSGAVYTVVITNQAGSVTSNAATLTVVRAAARITTQPTDASVLDGDAATFTVATLGGTPPITFQWFRNGTAIPGATGASHTTSGNAMSDSGAVYRVTITAAGGAVNSRDARLTVTPRPPTVTTQPTSTSSQFQTSATFTVQATGTAGLTYQWYRNGIQLGNEVGATLTVGSVHYGDDGARYSVVVRNGGGEVSSQAAVLTVTPPPGTVQTFSSCVSINAPGAYRLSANIPAINLADASCITIAASNVQLDCAGFSLGATGTNSSAIALGPVQNVSIKGCRLQTTRMTFDRVTNVSFHDNVFPAGAAVTAIEANHATQLAFDNNTVELGNFRQLYGRNVTVSNNRFTTAPGNSSLPSIVASSFGQGTRVTGNTLDGKWDTTRRGSQIQNGAHSGIDIEDESDVLIEGNSVTHVFTCGVELLGNISGLRARNNRISEAGQCGFTGNISFSLASSDFTGNTIDRSAIAFFFFRTGGLRGAGFDQPDHLMPADTAVTFKDVTIARNTLSNAIAADGNTAVPPTVVILPITTRMNYVGPPASGETEPGSFDLRNVLFTGNNFDRTAAPMEFGQGTFTDRLIVDGGGNTCPRSVVPGFPIACN